MSDYIERNAVFTHFEVGESWAILSPIEQSIKRKIEAVGKPLKDWDVRINYGIKTGFNDAFIINGQKKDELIAKDPKSAEIIRPILRGRDIKRYGYNFGALWIIATFPSRNYDIDKYPAVKEHLLSFGMERLEQTGKTYIINGKKVKARKKTNNKWFETQDSIGYWEDFNKQKIAWGNLCLEPQFALIEEGFFISAPAPLIVPGNEYLLTILNSKLADFYLRTQGVSRNGGYFEYKPMFIEKIPIVANNNLKLDTVYRNNDNIICKLYSLNDDETSYIINKKFK